MGTLTRSTDGRRFTLLHETRVGRSRRSDLRLKSGSVSSHHALIHHRAGRWLLRDISQNGTLLNDGALTDRLDHPLEVGARLMFGQRDDQIWVLEEDAPPGAAAFGPHGVRRDALDGVLVLPDDERISATIERVDEQWICETRRGARVVVDGDCVIVDDEPWQVSLPQPLPPTYQAKLTQPTVAELRLVMRVSRDGETFETRFEHDGGVVELPHRSHHAVLHQLARYMLDDRQAHQPEAGWYPVELLCGDCELLRPTLDVYVRRLRQQLSRARVQDASALIERRDGKIRMAPIPISLAPMG